MSAASPVAASVAASSPATASPATASLAALGSRIAATAAWAMVGIVVARALPVEDRGAYATTIVGVTAILALLSGVAAAGGRAVARQQARPDEAVGAGVRAGLLAAAACLAGALALVAAGAGQAAIVPFVAGAVALPAIVRSAVATAGLALDRTWVFNIGTHGPAFATLGLTAWLLVVAGNRSVGWALGAWIAGQLVALVAVTALRPAWVAGAIRDRGLPTLKRLSGFAALAGATSLVALLGARIDLLVVALFDGRHGAGLYATASAALDLLGAAGLAIAAGLYGRIGSAGPDEAARLTALGVRQALVAVGAGAVALATVAPQAIEVVFGARYVGASDAVRVMCLAAFVWAPQTVLSTYVMVGLGRPGLGLAIAGLSAGLEALLAVLLVPRLGIVGGAWASLGAYVVALVVYASVFRRTAGLPLAELVAVRAGDLAPYRALVSAAAAGQWRRTRHDVRRGRVESP